MNYNKTQTHSNTHSHTADNIDHSHTTHNHQSHPHTNHNYTAPTDYYTPANKTQADTAYMSGY